MFDHPSSSAQFVSLTKDCLTDCRSNIKQKLQISLVSSNRRKRAQGLSEITRSLTPKGIEISYSHWARVAYLRSLLVDFNSLTSKAEEPSDSAPANSNSDHTDEPEDEENQDEKTTWKPSQFWNFVDDALDKARAAAAEENRSRAEQEEWLSQFFNSVFMEDLRKYQGGTKAPPTPTRYLSEWQKNLQSLVWS